MTAICFVLEQRKSTKFEMEAAQLKKELGHIDVQDPSRVHLRKLKSIGENQWRYRIYIPPNFDLAFVGMAGDPATQKPRLLGRGGSVQTGQHTIEIFQSTGVMQEYRPHITTKKYKSFKIQFDGSSRAISWNCQPIFGDFEPLMGGMTNDAYPLLDRASHNDTVETFGIEDEIVLLMIKWPEKRLADLKPGETLDELESN